jgi:hypothetical protein
VTIETPEGTRNPVVQTTTFPDEARDLAAEVADAGGGMFTIETKQAVEFGEPVTLYSARFADGHQTCWYSNQLRAIAAGRRAAVKHGNASHDLACEVADALTPRSLRVDTPEARQARAYGDTSGEAMGR